MQINYKTQGTCATSISFELEDGKLHNISFTGGCNGNLKAISKLCEGRPAEEVAEILAGNTCGFKSTSCADQFSKAILSAVNEA
ncbi:MAG: TIGR03905 family TSCPD domain-containing protein [Lachnospiraceae bacterium]|nr:TIGR03905 family TSCPD domain-containing protein [Lachnospiraceae bacterium]